MDGWMDGCMDGWMGGLYLLTFLIIIHFILFFIYIVIYIQHSNKMSVQSQSTRVKAPAISDPGNVPDNFN